MSILAINGEGLDLTTDPEGALAAIQSKVSQSSYYSEYLADQLDNLERMINYVEFEKYNDMGVEADQFDAELAKEVAGVAATATLEELMVLFDAQSNVESEKALQLLREELYGEAP